MAKMTVEETKELLKKEIIRLGIQDNPSRTVYQKEYERGAAPSPNSAMNVTGMKWQDLMHELGFKYDGQKAVAQGRNAGGRRNKNKKYGLRLNNSEILMDVVEKALLLIHDLNINNKNQFKQELPNYINTTYNNLTKHGYPFEKLKELYKEKYDEEIKNEPKGRWNNVDKKELLRLLIKAMVDNNLDSLKQYKEWRKGNNDYPSVATLQRRLDMTYAELNKLAKTLK